MEKREDDRPEEVSQMGDLAPRVEEYLATIGTHVAGQPPGFWQELIAEYFEGERHRRELQRMRADWFAWRRRRLG